MGQSDQPVDAGTLAGGAEPNGEAGSWKLCDGHRYSRRGDVLVWQCIGPMQVSDLQHLYAERAAIHAELGRAFLLVDAQQIDGVPPETRRFAAQTQSDPPGNGITVVMGASKFSQTLLTLIIRAARLLGRSEQVLSKVHFVDTEAEAWALIDRHRSGLLAAVDKSQ